jgi:hypothetical protein
MRHSILQSAQAPSIAARRRTFRKGLNRYPGSLHKFGVSLTKLDQPDSIVPPDSYYPIQLINMLLGFGQVGFRRAAFAVAFDDCQLHIDDISMGKPAFARKQYIGFLASRCGQPRTGRAATASVGPVGHYHFNLQSSTFSHLPRI